MKKQINNKLAFWVILALAIIVDICSIFIQKNLNAKEYKIMATWAVLVFVSSYQLLKIITNDNKDILTYATIIVSSAEVLLLGNNAPVFICAQFFLVVLEKLTQNKIVVKNEKNIKKDKYNIKNDKYTLFFILLALVIIMSFLCGVTKIPREFQIDQFHSAEHYNDYELSYSFVFAMFYVMVIIGIWIILKNIKNCKWWAIIIGGVLMICLVCVSIVANTVDNTTIYYTTQRYMATANYSNGLAGLFGYMYNFVGLFTNVEGFNWDTTYTIVSVFPVPLFIGMWYLFKNNKHEKFLFPVVVGMTLTTIFAMIGGKTPEVLQIITGAKWINTTDWVFVSGLLGLYLMFYLMSNTDEKLFNITPAIRLTIVMLVLSAIVPLPAELSTRFMRTIYCVPFTLLSFLMIQYNANKKYQRACVKTLAFVSILEFLIYIGFFIGR